MYMRELKFRTWSKIKKQWLNSIILGDGGKPLLCYVEMDDNQKITNKIFTLDELEPIVQQFTGLLDINGKEIYEGDILQFRKRGGIISDCSDYIDAIKWNDKFYCWGFQKELDALGFYSCFEKMWNPKIIGNIFENPELIEKK